MDAIYLDHAATTPVRDEVRAAMGRVMEEAFGNPSSAHRWGRAAAAALDEARERCAKALGAQSSEIHFVRGGTESDNLAVLGRVARLRGDGALPTVVVSEVEHKAVLEAAKQATLRGAGHLVHLKVGADGSLDLAALDAALDRGPAVVSIMWVNNETGHVLDVPAVAERTVRAGATLHTDAVQAVGKIPVRVDDVPVDLLSVTGHKIYGPRGVGLLYVRSGTLMNPILHGGGQERGLRPGTEDVEGAVGLSVAVALAVQEQPAEAPRLEGLRNDLERRLSDVLEGLRINGQEADRAPHVSSLAVPDVDGSTLLMAMDLEGLGASGGSACNSGVSAGSHVISALYGPDDPHATVRFSLGRTTTAEQVARAADITVSIAERLREGSPA